MGLQRRTKSISALTRSLLSEGESERADFKRSPDGVNADDLVAFGNTAAGGNILVGIEEIAGPDGAQRGSIKGCDVSDSTVLQILNKAVSCIPPVAIDIHIENLRAKPILRIEIPPSENKPHCTPKGIYCRRDGSRNRPLHPAELLRIFLDTEARAFAERFESAANRIAEDLSGLETTLKSSIRSMGDKLGWAELQLGDTESVLDSILRYIRKLDDAADDSASRLRALFRQDNRDDPVRASARKKLLDRAIKQLSEDRKLFEALKSGGATQVTVTGKEAIELDKEDVQSVLAEAVKEVGKTQESRKYKTDVKKPTQCSREELDKFAEAVSEGGEIVAGVRQRLEKAAALGFIRYNGKIVGTAALKKPALAYRKRIFENANSGASASDYPLELGWIYLQPDHRQKKQMRPLIDTLVTRAGSLGIFATARTANQRMAATLRHQGFVAVGSAFPSKQRPAEELQLYVRRPAPMEDSQQA